MVLIPMERAMSKQPISDEKEKEAALQAIIDEKEKEAALLTLIDLRVIRRELCEEADYLTIRIGEMVLDCLDGSTATKYDVEEISRAEEVARCHLSTFISAMSGKRLFSIFGYANSLYRYFREEVEGKENIKGENIKETYYPTEVSRWPELVTVHETGKKVWNDSRGKEFHEEKYVWDSYLKRPLVDEYGVFVKNPGGRK